MSKHRIKSIGDALESILKEYDLEKPYCARQIMNHWNDLVNKQISAISKPVELTDDVLIVEAASESWKNELNRKKQAILDTINSKQNSVKIREIRFI